MSMMASGGKKSTKKPGRKKGKIEEWFINVLAIVLLCGGLVFIVYMTTQMSSQHSKDTDQYLASIPLQSDTISHSKICMADDIYQGDYPTLPLKIANSTYYGCDFKAIHELTSKKVLRTAIDPVSKKRLIKHLH